MHKVCFHIHLSTAHCTTCELCELKLEIDHNYSFHFYEQEIVLGEMPVTNHSSEEFSDPELRDMIQRVCNTYTGSIHGACFTCKGVCLYKLNVLLCFQL